MAKEGMILTKLFAGYDDGHYDLPPELLARRKAETNINAEYAEVTALFAAANPAAVRAQIVRELIEAAGSDDLPTNYEAPFVAAQDELRRVSAAQSIILEARLELAEKSPWVASQLSEQILSEYLRPAMATLLDRVRAGAEIAARVPWGDQRALVAAGKPVREYHEIVATANEEYIALRTAQRLLMTLTGHPSADSYHTFGELENMPALWPQRDSGVPGIRGRAPWPDGIARMVWLTTSEAKPWMPTAVECDAAMSALLSKNPLRGGVVAGTGGYVAVPAGSGLDRMKG